ncbi:unnamed protein product [Dicrocoelium dendriticum]|nr:unnamed protein product [Dicrocoelium dendriticum]
MQGEPYSQRLSEQASLPPSNNTSGNIDTGTSSTIWESSSTCSLNDISCSKYKFFYHRLFKCLRYLEDENLRLLDAIRNRVRVSAECKPLEELLDDFAFKVASKKDAYEKALIAQAATQGQHAFMAKQWKMRYKNLLEVATLLKTKCDAENGKASMDGNSSERRSVENEYFEEVCSVPWNPKFDYGTAMENALLDIDVDLELPGCNRRASIYEFLDMTIPISSVFIQDLLANHSLTTEEIKHQNEMKCRLFHVLKKTKEQRNQLKAQVCEQETEIQRLEQEVHDKELAMSKCKTGQQVTVAEVTHDTSSKWEESQKVSGLMAPPTKSDDFAQKLDLAERSELEALQAEIKSLEYRKLELTGILKEEEQQRRRLSKRLQDLVGTIHVSCRIKPHPANYLKVISDDKLLFPKVPPNQNSLKNRTDSLQPLDGEQLRCFIFERVIGAGSGHYEIFKKLGQPITKCLDGQNLCVMTYGPKHSGKSFTMFGNASSQQGDNAYASKGIAQDTVHLLLSLVRQRVAWTYTIYLRAVSVTDEGVTDLLKEGHLSRWDCIAHSNNGDCTLSLKSFELTNSSEFDSIVHRLRSKENSKHTSRLGHFLVHLTIDGQQKAGRQNEARSTLILADLASWENPQTREDSDVTSVAVSTVVPVVNSSDDSPRSVGEQVSGGVNQSLLALSRLFTTLRKRKTPGFKDSPLTWLLKPVLVGYSKCFLIITIDSDPNEFASTLASLQFAQNAMQATTCQWPKSHQHIRRNSNRITQLLDRKPEDDTIGCFWK